MTMTIIAVRSVREEGGRSKAPEADINHHTQHPWEDVRPNLMPSERSFQF
jgi:hypothetical protein